MGVKRKMRVVERRQNAADWDLVSEVVRSCQVCEQIDPAPVVWPHGHLDEHRVEADSAYVGGKPYLTVIDYRFAIWTALR